MKKILLIAIGAIIILIGYKIIFGSYEEIIPYENKLFIIKEDLINIGLTQFKYIENKIIPKNSLKKERNFGFTAELYYKNKKGQEKFEPEYMDLTFVEYSDIKFAEEYLKMLKSFSGKNNSFNIKDTEHINNYKKLGDENILTMWTDEDKKIGKIIIKYKKYIVTIQIITNKGYEKITEYLEKLSQLMINKINSQNI